LLWKPIITDKIAARKKDNFKYYPRVSSGLFQTGANSSKKIPVIPGNKEKTKNMIFTFFENNPNCPLLQNSSTINRYFPYTLH